MSQSHWRAELFAPIHLQAGIRRGCAIVNSPESATCAYTVTIKQATGFAPLLPKDIPATLAWQPAWYYKFGGTRYLDNGWSLSAGYIDSENAMPDAHYSPLIADSARHWLSIGTGFKRRRFDLDIAYQFGIGDGVRTVSGSAPSATGQTADGRYTYISHAVLATVGFHF